MYTIYILHALCIHGMKQIEYNKLWLVFIAQFTIEMKPKHFYRAHASTSSKSKMIENNNLTNLFNKRKNKKKQQQIKINMNSTWCSYRIFYRSFLFSQRERERSK